MARRAERAVGKQDVAVERDHKGGPVRSSDQGQGHLVLRDQAAVGRCDCELTATFRGRKSI